MLSTSRGLTLNYCRCVILSEGFAKPKDLVTPSKLRPGDEILAKRHMALVVGLAGVECSGNGGEPLTAA